MNPVPVMPLVELVRGIATEDANLPDHARLHRFARQDHHATAEDFPAFIVNRILLPMINEAIYTLYEGVGSVEAIDTAMKLGANHPMGPLQLADFIGLDTCLSIMQVLHDGLSDSKYRPCPLLVKYVEAGWLGPQIRPRISTTIAAIRRSPPADPDEFQNPSPRHEPVAALPVCRYLRSGTLPRTSAQSTLSLGSAFTTGTTSDAISAARCLP
jgi:3-hydroxyacyl-CoA dehydrogenase